MSSKSYLCPTQPSPIPRPPGNDASCAVPLGGSNTTIIDTCCNGHINRILPYSNIPSSTPGRNSTSILAPNGCHLFCTPGEDALGDVRACLAGLLSSEGGKEGGTTFECFEGRKEGVSHRNSDYESAAVGRRRGGWVTLGILWIGVLGSLIGGL